MKRSILVIHPYKVAREVIKRYIYSELVHVVLQEAQTLEKATNLLASKRYDLILCCHEYGPFRGTDVYQLLRNHVLNQETTVIALTSPNVPVAPDALAEYGIEEVIELPTGLHSIAEHIAQATNPTALRTNKRFHIPDLQAVISHLDGEVTVPIHNISTHGILCEVEYSSQINWFEVNNISILPPPGQEITLQDVSSQFLRAEIIEWDESNKVPQVLQIVWYFESLSEQQLADMQLLLENAEEYLQTEIWDD